MRLARSLLRRLELTAMTHNRAAVALYEKAGFGQAVRLMLGSFNDGTRKSIR
jgi:ribosomal protein S18 acetylase RimI-like enzyme